MQLVPLLLLAPVLCAVAYCDLRYMLIPNRLVLAAVALFVVTAPLVGTPEAMIRLVVAALVLAVLAAGFALRLVGGGDVKMLAALFLFIPSGTYGIFGLTFAAAMVLGISFVLLLRRTPVIRELDMVSLQTPGTFPMGIAIAGAGLVHPFLVSALA